MGVRPVTGWECERGAGARPKSAAASVEAVDLPRGQVFGITVDQGAPGLEAEMAGVHRAGLWREPVDLGEARRTALDEGAADRAKTSAWRLKEYF